MRAGHTEVHHPACKRLATLATWSPVECFSGTRTDKVRTAEMGKAGVVREASREMTLEQSTEEK